MWSLARRRCDSNPTGTRDTVLVPPQRYGRAYGSDHIGLEQPPQPAGHGVPPLAYCLLVGVEQGPLPRKGPGDLCHVQRQGHLADQLSTRREPGPWLEIGVAKAQQPRPAVYECEAMRPQPKTDQQQREGMADVRLPPVKHPVPAGHEHVAVMDVV